MSSMLIKNVSIADPDSGFNGKVLDIYIEKGIIKKIGKQLKEKALQVIEAKGKYLSPSWISLMADFAEPGYEHRETIDSGLNAAANGGFGQVILVPNTDPGIANKSTVEFVQQRAAGHKVRLNVLGAISQKLEGKNLAEMMEMYHAGAKAFSDGWKPVQNAGLLQKALEYVKAFDGLVVQLPLMASLADGLMNEGENSVKFGMPGIPNIAESLFVHRDIELARYTGSKLHISGITTADSLALVKKAKKEGVQVSCSVTPYHLLFTDAELISYNSLFKVDPPLRTEKDRKALIKALEDGTIDCIAIHHKPQDWDAKVKEFEYATSGMAAMELAWPMLLKAAPNVSAERWADLCSNNIARIFKLDKVTVEEGAVANFTLFDTTTTWTLNKEAAQSMAYNIPLLGTELKGKAVLI